MSDSSQSGTKIPQRKLVPNPITLATRLSAEDDSLKEPTSSVIAITTIVYIKLLIRQSIPFLENACSAP